MTEACQKCHAVFCIFGLASPTFATNNNCLLLVADAQLIIGRPGNQEDVRIKSVDLLACFYFVGELLHFLVVEEGINNLVGIYHDQRRADLREDPVLAIAAMQVAEDLWFVQHVHVAHVGVLLLCVCILEDIGEGHRDLLGAGPTSGCLGFFVTVGYDSLYEGFVLA